MLEDIAEGLMGIVGFLIFLFLIIAFIANA